jgi:hypothetical protein
MATTDIPIEARIAVESRDGLLCVRCRHFGADWHHRRTRAVDDRHRHCPCNGVLLCRTCHSVAHRMPEASRMLGLIVSRFCECPWMVPVKMIDGWWELDCEGGARSLQDRNVVLDEGIPMVIGT